MKRLLDDNVGGLERSLLQVGRDVRSDGSGKARLLTAVAAGTLTTAAGIAASRAAVSPWWKSLLATKVGKMTALSLVVAGAGTAAVTVQHRTSQQTVVAKGFADAPEGAGAPSGTVASRAARIEPSPTSASAPLPQAVAPAERPAASVKDAAPASAPPVDPRSRRVPRVAELVTGQPPSRVLQASALVAEARLVERLRQAAQHGEKSTFGSLLAEYKASYPEGQLGPEVNKLERQVSQPQE